MVERKVLLPELSGNGPAWAGDDSEVELVTADEVLHGLTPERVAVLLFGISPNYVRELRKSGRITGTGKKGRYTARSVLLERRRRQKEAGLVLAAPES